MKNVKNCYFVTASFLFYRETLYRKINICQLIKQLLKAYMEERG